MKLPAFDYHRPATLEGAVAFLAAADGRARILAGGQSLLPIMAFRLAAPEILVDITRLPGLRGIEETAVGLRIGALTRWRDILESSLLAWRLPLLPAAVAHVAHYQIRNRGTVGGSLAHADPAAELPCIALTCEAVVEIVGPSGYRGLATADLIAGPMQTSLAPDEILTAVTFPAWPKRRRWGFEEFSIRRGDFALAAVALHYDQTPSGISAPHIGLMGAVEHPQRLTEVEVLLDGHPLTQALIEKAAACAAATIDPVADAHGSTNYRRALTSTLLSRALRRTLIQEAT